MVCSGTEQPVRTDASRAKPGKPYRISVDVCQCSGPIYVKSLHATPWPRGTGKLHFASQYLGSWIAGLLDEKTGTINIILEHHLNFDGID